MVPNPGPVVPPTLQMFNVSYLKNPSEPFPFFLTESWHKENEGLLFNQITPGFGILNLPRSSGRGDGIFVVYNLQFNISAVSGATFILILLLPSRAA